MSSSLFRVFGQRSTPTAGMTNLQPSGVSWYSWKLRSDPFRRIATRSGLSSTAVKMAKLSGPGGGGDLGIGRDDQGIELLRRGVDSEEAPYYLTDQMGSIHFYDHQTDRRGFHVALISDLVGHDVEFRSYGDTTPEEIRQLVCVLGAEIHPALPGLLKSTPLPNGGLAAISLRNSYAPDQSGRSSRG